MKFALLKQNLQSCHLYSGFLALVVNLFLTSTSLAQNADTSIAFTSTRSGNSEIYRMSADGKRVRRLTKHPKYDGGAAWSPDGQQITFISFRDQNRIQNPGIVLGEIYLINANGTDPINLTQSIEKPDLVSSWSPDGKQIAFGSSELFVQDDLFRSDIWVMDVDGGNSRNLTKHGAQDMAPDWSPDGNQIAFSSDRDGNWEIYVMNADGTNPTNLTKHPAKDSRPAWSPDAELIAFSSHRDKKDEADKNVEIYMMNPDGTNPINLTNHPAMDSRPSWSPDGKRIAFQSNRDENWEVYVMNADGANPINLTNHPAWDGGPSWGPAPTLNVSSNGHGYRTRQTTTCQKRKCPHLQPCFWAGPMESNLLLSR